MTPRCDELLIQLVVRTYDDHDRPVREEVSQPLKVFRAVTPDVWAEVDKALAGRPGMASGAPRELGPNDPRDRSEPAPR
jgi:hypothetical protein